MTPRIGGAVTGLALCLLLCSGGCKKTPAEAGAQGTERRSVAGTTSAAAVAATTPATRPARAYKLVHVFVALCDNKNQGIVPVPAGIGNGQDPASNLYWGAKYGVKNHLARGGAWTAVRHAAEGNDPAVLDRVVFRSAGSSPAVWIVAEAYDGAKMKQALAAFVQSAAGQRKSAFTAGAGRDAIRLEAGGLADMVCFVGHNGLMDAAMDDPPRWRGGPRPDCAVILACKSREYFAPLLKDANCPIRTATTGLMCPEAYTLDAIVRSWAAGEKPAQTLQAAAAAYAKYQHCSLSAAGRLFVTEMR